MKKNKKEQDSKNKKFLSKKILLVGLIVCTVSFLLGFYFSKNEEEPLVAENYVVDLDSVESITSVTQKGVLTDIIPNQEEGQNKVEYIYKLEDDSEETIDEYIKFLQDEKGFVELDEEQGDNSSDFNLAIESQEENKLFKITIQQNDVDFCITAFLEEGKLPSEDDLAFTRDNAKSYLKNFINESNELPTEFDNYTSIFDVGRSIINDEECYGVSIYQKSENQCNEFVGKYFISLKEKNIYKYDNLTGQSTKIS